MRIPDLDVPDGVDVHTAETADALAAELASQIAHELRAHLEIAPRATLVVSGGSTPVPFFAALSQQRLEWPRVDICLADERWVEEQSDDSNAALVRRHLLQGDAAGARFVSLKQPGATPAEALPLVEDALAQMTWPPAALVLGMGNDGHTASLFPDAPELAHALEGAGSGRVCAMTPPSQPQARITLTEKALGSASFTALLLRGEDKLRTLTRASYKPDHIAEMPIRAFLKPGLQVYWSP